MLFTLGRFSLHWDSAGGALPPEPIDINSADSLTLLALPGLSPGKVNRLLALRQGMGGFWDTNEVRLALDSADWARLASEVFVRKLRDSVERVDLNTIDSLSLAQSMLCRPSVARSLIRYRYKVRGFRSWAQIDSFRSLHPIERYRLRTYGYLGEKVVDPSRSLSPPYALIDLNLATAEELEKLPGIGRKSAERILSYREKLGGYFVSVEQLREIWGIRSENIEKALPYLYIRHRPKPKLSLRQASVEELAAHPYISWRLARYLVRKRQAWGEQPIPTEVWSAWLPDSVRSKLIPYLTSE